MVLTIAQAGHGTVKTTGFPIKFTEAPCTIRYPVPELSAHTDYVLRELGYSETDITTLRAEGDHSA
jgi:crotonobetainyl-CoA:carnitine CoA-transferase CaiB-like acyl-CoA transferase